MTESKIIIVEGLIAVGKTTALSKTNPEISTVFKEEYDPKDLDIQYKTPTPLSCHKLQDWFHDMARVKMQQAVENDKHSYLDRSFVGCLAFSLLNLSLGNLDSTSKILINSILADVRQLKFSTNVCLVYLLDNLNKVCKRVRSRGRSAEQTMSDSYQRKLQIWYAIVLSLLKNLGVPVMTLKGFDEFDTVHEKDPDELFNLVRFADQSPTKFEFDIDAYLRIAESPDIEKYLGHKSSENARQFLDSLRIQ